MEGDGGGRGNERRRGYPYPRRWMSNKQGNKGRGRGVRGKNANGNFGEERELSRNERENGGNSRRIGVGDSSCDHPSLNEGRDNGALPPPTKKKRLNGLQLIKTNVVKQWMENLPGYDMYYYDKLPQLPESDTKISAVNDFLVRNGLVSDMSAWEDSEDQSYFAICVEDVIKDEKFCDLWPEFSEDLLNNPEDTVTLWSAAAHKAVFNAVENHEQSSEESFSNRGETPTVQKIMVGFTQSDPVTSLLAIKSGFLGKFVTIRGAVIRTGNIHPYCLRLAFRCQACDDEFVVEQPEGKYTPPTICKAEECKNTRAYLFEPLESSSRTVMIDAKRIRVQDIQHCDMERGSVPRTIDCELFGALANQCSTGDAVTLSGIIKMSRETNYGGEQSLHHMYIETSGIKQHKESERTMGGHLFSFTNKDYYAIKAIHSSPNLFRLLIASLCPSIFGHEIVKAGLLLCLFGGTPQADGYVSKRSDLNMLMIGDPGIGKSQMLKVVAEVAPRAVYVCGTGSTVAGLTVTLVRDGEDYSLEAGALVMADRGVCCIDEFDKMTAQHHALLEALEQQSVSIAKSGVFRTLPARASVIAAANSVGGHYDNCKSVNENIKINPALLSRFDLIFILLDKPNKEFDLQIIEHMMEIRKTTRISPSQNGRPESNDSEFPLRFIDKVTIQRHEVLDLIPHVLLRKYIAYAKQYVKPRITSDAAALLKKYYINLRLTHRGLDSTPVTARQLESLVRLTEARAKLELREVATVEDAKDILEIFDFSLSGVFDSQIPAVSALEQSVLMNSSSSSKSGTRSGSRASQAKKLVVSLQQLAIRQAKNIFSFDEIKSTAVILGVGTDITSLIATLNNEGYLLKKGARTYQLQTVDF
ncbi:unnamed protein product [Orchesella dallaii]|uniref:DNA helicase MCM8 n=1 Tax=Orchesella dallaii TaxID=48710 RepID=A0ABP1Q7J7_9HEXA